MDPDLYLIRLAQVHPSFRKPELEALALLTGVKLEFVEYSEYSPYCIVRIPTISAAATLLTRSILSKAIYHLWASAPTYNALHSIIRIQSCHLWPLYEKSSFKFIVDIFNGSLSEADQKDIINEFAYLPLHGRIAMKNPDEEFVVCQDHEHGAGVTTPTPKMIYFGRLVGRGGRRAVDTYSLKKRAYISTTSMDAELALLTANLSLAAPGKLFYDPFVGTGSIVIACAHFGATTMGSDLDGRAVRGKSGKGVGWSLGEYGLGGRWLDALIGDITFSPMRGADGEGDCNSACRRGDLLDGIVCDPPYGVREGLKVLGSRDGSGKEVVWIDGKMAHLQDKYIPPKRPYSFEALLSDILEFAANMLVENGRLGLWMPTANDEEIELAIPEHPALEVESACVQPFHKWSRRLLTYRRKLESETPHSGRGEEKSTQATNRASANDLNNFRKRYFQSFKSAEESFSTEGLDSIIPKKQ
ncbi:hypothetical protein MMC17_006240 [Xylographa soralifera]|nr:hypothetical protein [Xylographa soralifera]